MPLYQSLIPIIAASFRGLGQRRLSATTAVLLGALSILPLSLGAQETTAPGPALTGTYVGRLGIYRQFVVLSLGEGDGRITGTYFYARHGKPLELRGDWDVSTGKGRMTESWQGELTGTFDFALTKEGMRGTWKAPGGESKPVEFTFMKFSHHESDPWDEDLPGRGFYEHKHLSWFWAVNEEGETFRKTFDTRSWVRITPITKQAFAFHYFVVGGNGHFGGVEGLAFRVDDQTAVYTQSDGRVPPDGPCVLRFEFSGDEVHILPIQDCGHFGGARIGIPEGRYRLGKE